MASLGPPLDVLFTVDTEFSPRSLKEVRPDYGPWIARDVDGRTRAGSYGVGYQLRVLDSFGLKGVFFVESLHANVVGFDLLKRVVGDVLARGHDVQLHVHSEWRPGTVKPKPGRAGDRMSDFVEADQARLIGLGLENLRRAGAPAVVAFRAGHYAADRATLRAVAANGLRFDSSYDRPHLDALTDFPLEPPVSRPTLMEGVVEIPIGFFRHLPGRYRHAQLCAVSREEMESALTEAAVRDFRAFVVVSHSFELISRKADDPTGAEPRPLVIKRFQGLCEFLDARRDRMRTAAFADLDVPRLLAAPAGPPLASSLGRTLNRYAQQVTGLGS